MVELQKTSQEMSPLEKSFGMGFTDVDELLDFLEFKMVELGDLIDCEVKHRFSPGLYTREAHAPTGALLTSMTHKTDHQYIVSTGACLVFIEGEGWKLIEAPFHGLTKAGTRRLIYVIDSITWTSFHPTDKTTVEEVQEDIIVKRTNKMLTT